VEAATLAAHPVVADMLGRCTFPQDGPLCCAVSGGADSSALLLLCVATGRDVGAIHVDHGLRAQSSRDADAVVELGARFGVEVAVHRVDLAEGPNLEARARQARLSVFPPHVLTGHTADDRAETVLLQLLRGGALDALASMSSRGRPLLALRRADTEAVCAAAKYRPVVDATNQEQRFRRNRVRHEVLPLVAEVMERDPVPLLNRAAEIATDERALLDELAAEIDPTDVRALAAAPIALARRAVRSWLHDGHPPDAASVDRVLAVAAGDAVACEIAGGRRVARRAGRLTLHPRASAGDR